MNAADSLGLGRIIILAIIPVCWPTQLEIIEPRGLSRGLKRGAEFELALFTEMFGFVDYDHQLSGTPWNNILNQYLQYIRTQTAHLAFDTIITKDYFGENTEAQEQLCMAYLSDLIFVYNKIQFHPQTADHLYRYELKRVRLRYFSQVRVELVKVVGCPVQWDYGEAITRLYFQEIQYYHYSSPQNLSRGYFVFANIHVPPGSTQPLELLMFLPSGDQLPPLPIWTSQEARLYDALYERMWFAPRLPFRAPVWEQNTNMYQSYVFGKEAELHFLTKNYGFIDLDGPTWKPTRLISILDRIHKGYGVDRIKMKEIREDTNTVATCFNYIRNNGWLQRNGVYSREEFVVDTYNWIRKSVKFPMTHILESRYYELLQCPIRELDGQHYLYILPVHYLKPNKAPRVFTFLDPPRPEDGVAPGEVDPDEVVPFIFSKVAERRFTPPGNIDSENTADTEPFAPTEFTEVGNSSDFQFF